MPDGELVGKVARVTGSIAPGRIGEVMIAVRGGSEAFHAYASDTSLPITRETPMRVVEYFPPRTVVVSQARGLAEADAIKARAEALAQAVSQGAAGLQLARRLLARPDAAEAAAVHNGGNGTGSGRRKPAAQRAVEEAVSDR